MGAPIPISREGACSFWRLRGDLVARVAAAAGKPDQAPLGNEADKMARGRRLADLGYCLILGSADALCKAAAQSSAARARDSSMMRMRSMNQV